jgi:quinoprotein glucose dehydrogenase
MTFRFSSLLTFIALAFATASGQTQQQAAQWPTYGGDPGGMRYTPSQQITKANVTQLTLAWTFHTGSVGKNRPGTDGSSFETTPILFHDELYFTSPFDEVFALDPATGVALWQYDPKIINNPTVGLLTSRGVAAWSAPAARMARTASTSAPCSGRIFVATMDARLIALDAATGQPCSNFGNAGTVDLSKNVDNHHASDPYFFTSPPTVIGDLVVIGSAIGDNQRVDIDSGVVRAYDCRSGRLVWTWDPIPWAQNQKVRTGAANAWGVIAADPEHNLVFVPTGAPSPDFYGGLRPGDNRDANSVVALEATTGRRVWGFQVVHHDLWDYDVAAEPLLFTWHNNIPAVAITTKQGMIFVLNRLTGEPLFPVTERPVPQSDVPGEQTSPTQPFQDIASLSPLTPPVGAKLGATPQDDAFCRKAIGTLRYEGIYTPPSIPGTVLFPGSLGGVNWGSASFDPAGGILYANTNRYAFEIRLVAHPTPRQQQLSNLLDNPSQLVAICTSAAILIVLLITMVLRRSFAPGRPTLAIVVTMTLVGFVVLQYFAHRPPSPPRAIPRSVEHFGHEFSPQSETPYAIDRVPLVTPSGMPCAVAPWGTVSAVNLNTGKPVWQSPLGTLIPGQHTGTINLGGDVVTAAGLLFTGASEQPLLRAFDSTTGEELWTGDLPAPAQSTPMSYMIAGRQFVVVAAGGHGAFGTPISDALVAFALPKP